MVTEEEEEEEVTEEEEAEAIQRYIDSLENWR
jgi:hypothetical protein